MNLNDFDITTHSGLYISKDEHPIFGKKYIARFQYDKKRYVKVLGYEKRDNITLNKAISLIEKFKSSIQKNSHENETKDDKKITPKVISKNSNIDSDELKKLKEENSYLKSLLGDYKKVKHEDLVEGIQKIYDLLEQMEKMENEIFLKNISSATQIKRLYRFKRKVGLNQKVLNLSSEWVNSFDKLPLETVEIKDLKDSYKDALSDYDHLNLQTGNLISMFIALSDQKANQVMKMLAIYSVYFLPITFIAGLYGMNFKFMPELQHPYGYFATVGVMVLIVIITFIYFRRKKW